MKDDFGSFANLQSFETHGIKENADYSSFGMESDIAPQPTTLSSGDSDSLEAYGMSVIKSMVANGVSPTPYNYKIYFEKMLEDKSQDFRDNAAQFIDMETIPTEKQIILEGRILKTQNLMVNTLKLMGAVYENMNLLQKLLEKHKKEAADTNNPNALQNIMTVLSKELEKLDEVTRKQLQEVNTSYNRSLREVESISSDIISDAKYGVYNKSYLDSRVAAEVQAIALGNYKSSLLMVKITKSLEKKITTEKNVLLVNKTIAKILQKISNKSDILAYYGTGIFGILLSHNDKESAKRYANRLLEKVITTNMYFGDEEISLSICSGIVEINSGDNPKDIIKNAVESLKKASNHNISFVVFGEK